MRVVVESLSAPAGLFLYSAMPPPSKPRIDELLAHADWVNALARRLAADAGRADDLAQDTWVAALRKRPAFSVP